MLRLAHLPLHLLQAQQANGKALEYACALAFQNALTARRSVVKIAETDATRTAQRRYEGMSEEVRHDYLRAAEASVKILERLEPTLIAPQPAGERFDLIIQADAQGEVGDVRDLLIKETSGWETGLSIKHNNDVVKNPRLSSGIDFGALWVKRPASAAYFSAIKPTFDRMESLADTDAHWSSLGLTESAKAKQFYRPVLEALARELERLANQHSDVPAALLRYFLGRKDFYKVIALVKSRVTIVQAYSIEGTLGRAAGNLKPAMSVPRLQMPSKILALAFKANSDNTIIINFNEGWQVSLRLHSASSRVERSLKLDVRLLSHPETLLILEQHWES